MKPTTELVQRTYLSLTLINTLAASLIWGINTLFLLEAGLNNTEAFLANAFFTIGQLCFEVPTGIIADTKGRRLSYLLGTLTLAASTLLYLAAWWWRAPFILWAISSVLLGLGFTFFSGATEAWLVDSLITSGYKKDTEEVFGKGQTVGGVAMLVGSFGGGLIAQFTSIAIPYMLRAGLLIVNFLIAFFYMHDWGFKPEYRKNPVDSFKKQLIISVEYGWRQSKLRWLMLAAPFGAGVGFYAFYAMQPHLLNLYGNSQAYWIAGLAASIVAGAQIVGGMSVTFVKKILPDRTSVMVAAVIINALLLLLIGLSDHFALTLILFCLWALVFAATTPVRQAYINSLIPSKQRATVISLDSFMGSAGGVVIQPSLGKVADVFGYPGSFLGASLFQSLAIPFVWLVKKSK